jgi:hypothetical protein
VAAKDPAEIGAVIPGAGWVQKARIAYRVLKTGQVIAETLAELVPKLWKIWMRDNLDLESDLRGDK